MMGSARGISRHDPAQEEQSSTPLARARTRSRPVLVEGGNQDPAPSLSHNLNGQRLGRKGRDTRERILAAATEVLASRPRGTAISLSAVARQASLGLSSLYNYFADLSELIQAVLEPVMETAQGSYLTILREHWADEDLAARAYAFVKAYHEFWVRHARLLHLRNAMSDRNDERMINARLRATQPIIALLVEQMGGDPLATRSRAFGMATVLMIGVERAVTTITDSELPMRLAVDIQHDPEHFLRPCSRLIEMAIRDIRGEMAAG